jgi:hypothetical protein
VVIRDRRLSGVNGTKLGKVYSLKEEREDHISTKTSSNIRVHSMETKVAGRKARNFRKRGRIKTLKKKPIEVIARQTCCQTTCFMVFQADISILYSTRNRTERDELLVSCMGAADTNESTSEVAVATRRQYLPDKIRINMILRH